MKAVAATLVVAIAMVLIAGCSTAPPVRAPQPSTKTVEMPEPEVGVVRPHRKKPRKPPPERAGPAPGWEKDSGPEDHEIPEDIGFTPDPEPIFEPPSRGGNAPSYTVFGKRYHTLRTARGFKQVGEASWYGKKFHGRKTSNGELYDMFELTAAHKTLPLPTYVWVRNLENGKEVIVRVNDRGPFHGDRIIDLSYAAAARLGTIGHIARVEVEAITPDNWPPRNVAAAASAQVASRTPVYLLQAGAFSDPINAVDTRETLAEKGFHTARIHIADDAQGRSLHRVVVGPFSGRQHMQEVRIRLRSAGFEAVLITE